MADPSVTNGATHDDYMHSGFDKGHMAPAEDQAWNIQVENESFLMTNMTPQAPSFNRGIWKLLETSFRGWVVELNTPFTAISGAVYTPNDKTIGKGVIVPHAFFKVVINDNTREVAGWWFPHEPPYPNLGNDLVRFRLPISVIQDQSGVIIPLPPNAQELPVGKEWPVSFQQLTATRKATCGSN
jgi:endonuclease G